MTTPAIVSTEDITVEGNSVESGAAAPAAVAPVGYRARFDPQAWIRDYAVSVDPEGPTTWDCTAAVRADRAYFDRLVTEGVHGDLAEGLLDNDDVLMGDPAAPEWVRNWEGPFSIWVTAAS